MGLGAFVNIRHAFLPFLFGFLYRCLVTPFDGFFLQGMLRFETIALPMPVRTVMRGGGIQGIYRIVVTAGIGCDAIRC